MSDTDKKKHPRRLADKTAAVYLAASIFCVAVTNVYALFGHGVRSATMDSMFLFPLLGGTVVFLLGATLSPVLQKRPRKGFRLGRNLYHSGIAALTSSAMLKGIMEIAGTDSPWIRPIRFIGICYLIAATACLLKAVFEQKINKG